MLPMHAHAPRTRVDAAWSFSSPAPDISLPGSDTTNQQLTASIANELVARRSSLAARGRTSEGNQGEHFGKIIRGQYFPDPARGEVVALTGQPFLLSSIVNRVVCFLL